MAAALWAVGCDDGVPTIEPDQPAPQGVVSNPVPSVSTAAGVTGSSGALAATEVAYVWLPPDSIPEGQIAFIRNVRTGSTARTAMAEGGFDPVPVAARAGDQLDLEIQVTGGGPSVRLTLEVPAYRNPRVVRTRPPAKKRDVVLNAVPSIIFSEPINQGTITSTSVQLLRGSTPVGGRITVSADGLRAEIEPDQLLAPNAEYVLVVRSNVEDLTGDSLEQSVFAAFSTGATTALAMAYTDPSALYVVHGYPALEGLLRTAEFEAILHHDGRVTGSYYLFFPETGWWSSGPVVCFSIAGDTTWVSGLIEDATKTEMIGKDIGWFAVDNGPPGGLADRLSLAWVGLASAGWGTAQDHCDKQPTEILDGPDKGRARIVQDVETGDIVVAGNTPPPPGVGRIALPLKAWRRW